MTKRGSVAQVKRCQQMDGSRYKAEGWKQVQSRWMEAGTKQKARHTQGPTARYKEGRKDMVGWCARPLLGQDARYQLRAAGA